MPDPANYDNRDDWLEVCIPTAIDEGRERDQAVAMCMQMWRDRDKAVGDGATAAKALPAVDRAWSLLTVKAVQEERRIIRGLATSPETDRVGDIVEPLGIKFKNPMPLLLYHKHGICCVERRPVSG